LVLLFSANLGPCNREPEGTYRILEKNLRDRVTTELKIMKQSKVATTDSGFLGLGEWLGCAVLPMYFENILDWMSSK
jgi:hypothetical protein